MEAHGVIGRSGFMQAQDRAANAAGGEARAGKAGEAMARKGAQGAETSSEESGAERREVDFAALLAASAPPAESEPAVEGPRLRKQPPVFAAPEAGAGPETDAPLVAVAPPPSAPGATPATGAADAPGIAALAAEPVVGKSLAAKAKAPELSPDMSAEPVIEAEPAGEEEKPARNSPQGGRRDAPKFGGDPAPLSGLSAPAPQTKGGADGEPAPAPERLATPGAPPAPQPARPAAGATAAPVAIPEISAFDPLAVDALTPPGRSGEAAARLEIAALAPPGQGAPEPRLAAQIVGQITVAASKGEGDKVEIRLDPPELGKVKLSFAMSETGVTAHVSVERPEAYDLLRRHGEMLERELNASGFSNVSLDFSRSNEGSGGGERESAGAEPHQRPGHGAGNDAALVTVAWRPGAKDGLDIRL